MDRHLTALQALASAKHLSCPLFESVAFQALKQTVLFISGISHVLGIETFTCGPLNKQGYGIAYVVKADSLIFSIVRHKLHSKKLIPYLEKSLQDMIQIGLLKE